MYGFLFFFVCTTCVCVFSMRVISVAYNVCMCVCLMCVCCVICSMCSYDVCRCSYDLCMCVCLMCVDVLRDLCMCCV